MRLAAVDWQDRGGMIAASTETPTRKREPLKNTMSYCVYSWRET